MHEDDPPSSSITERKTVPPWQMDSFDKKSGEKIFGFGIGIAQHLVGNLNNKTREGKDGKRSRDTMKQGLILPECPHENAWLPSRAIEVLGQPYVGDGLCIPGLKPRLYLE